VAKATAKGPVPTGIVATTLLLAVPITETVFRVRLYLLRFNSFGNFCDGGAIYSRGTL
jgi:hypothetical protein